MLTSLYCPMCGAEVTGIVAGERFVCPGCDTKMMYVDMRTFYVLEFGQEDE